MGPIETLLKNPVTTWIYWFFFRYYNEYKYASKNLSIGYEARFRNCRFGRYNKIYEEAHLSNVVLGDYSYVSRRSRVSNATIGKFSCIGPDVVIGTGKHPTRGFVSSHPAFYSTRAQSNITFVTQSSFEEFAPVTIGNDVWIGAQAILLDGVSIADGAVIGAGAVVARNVPAYAVVSGVPAKLSRYRFESRQIEYLLNFKWWDRDQQWLQQNASSFTDIEKFVATHDGNKSQV